MSNGTCPEIDKYLAVLRLILDNESSAEEEQYLMNHLDQCSCCLKEYEIETQVRELLKSKLKQKSVPSGLANSIKAKIIQSKSNVR
ncbi:MAG: anti-sigma factor [Cytophagales bacterium]|nr:anti-sigma factor [Cytophagales bacterium]